VEVSALPIAEVGSNGKHVAGVAEAKARLIRKADGEVQRTVIDGVRDEVHDLAVDLGILPAQPFLLLLAAPFGSNPLAPTNLFNEYPTHVAFRLHRCRRFCSRRDPSSSTLSFTNRPDDLS
jgi:hypothetical protein